MRMRGGITDAGMWPSIAEPNYDELLFKQSYLFSCLVSVYVRYSEPMISGGITPVFMHINSSASSLRTDQITHVVYTRRWMKTDEDE